MLTIDKNDFGKIKIDKEILYSLVYKSFDKFQNEIYLPINKGLKFQKFTIVGSIYSHINFEVSKNKKLNIYLDVFIKFGKSIKLTTEKLAIEIKSNIENEVGISVEKINIHIVGTESKNIIKRDIEIEYNY